MKRRAFVIGSETGGLQGVLRDARRMQQALAGLGFSVDPCVGPQATRKGILTGYQKLIDACEKGDAAVIYYSGHGGRLRAPARHGAPPGDPPTYVQCLVPHDFDKSEPTDFRGILTHELSWLLKRLTDKTENVTVLLDCCHSARMFRGVFRPKTLPHPLHVDVEALVRALERGGIKELSTGPIDLTELGAQSNPHVVRLAAARSDQSAFEYENKAGESVGMMTESLLLALADAKGAPVTWRALAERVRERVLAIEPQQRPEIEGPASRLLFALDERAEGDALAVAALGGEKALLRGGRIVGVRVGDEYAIMPMSALGPSDQGRVAIATVIEVRGADSVAKISYEPDHHKPPEGARAFPLKLAPRQRPVVVDAPEGVRETIAEAFAKSPFVSIEAAARAEAPPLVTVRVEGQELTLARPNGELALAPGRFSPGDLSGLKQSLCTMAAAQSVRELEGTRIRGFELDDLEVEWGRVEQGKTLPLPLTGAAIADGDHVYLRLKNRGARKVYVNILDIGVSDKVTLLSQAFASGVDLEPGDEEKLGAALNDTWTGVRMNWPESVPKDGLRLEEFLLVVTDKPVSLHQVQQQGLHALPKAQHSSHPGAPLEQLIAQFFHGTTREAATFGRADGGGFLVERIRFWLSPWPVPVDDGPFLFDARPDLTLTIAPPPEGFAPRPFSLRLTHFALPEDHALANADLRLDVLVATRSPSNGVAYHTETLRLGKGGRLPPGGQTIYQGEACDVLDLAVWASHDAKGALPLTDLLAAAPGGLRPKAQGPTRSAETFRPVSSVQLAAATEISKRVRLAGERLAEATAESLGIYRTSLLARENFGVGRHPPHRGERPRAEGVDFGYEMAAAREG